MPKILGLDVSIRKTGFCVVDTEAPSYGTYLEKGRLYTRGGSDGILIQRLIKQRSQIREKLEEHAIDFVSMEAPYFGGGESEELFALNQFIHEVFLEKEIFMIHFPPQQLKKLAMPGVTINSEEIGKNHMIMWAQKHFSLEGKVLTDDEADAMHVARIGKMFYNWHFAKTLTTKDVGKEFTQDILDAFSGKHQFTRGPRKGTWEYTGLIYRENELLFDFKKIKKRVLNQDSVGDLPHAPKK